MFRKAGDATEDSGDVTPVEEDVIDDRPQMYDLKKTQSKSGAGFNQFDPVLTLTTFLSRRFGLVGGLAIFAGLAATEGSEIFKSFTSSGPIVASGETVILPSGVSYQDSLIGQNGELPENGFVIGFNAVVSVGDKILYDTRNDKPVAFKLGQRPFQNIVCQGLEDGIVGMRVGSKRLIRVPQSLAPPGVQLPAGVPLVYDVEVTEVLRGYF